MSEQSSATTELQTIEPIVSNDLVELQKIFGANASIEPDRENWRIEVVLKDGVCPGGQTVNADLKRMKTKRSTDVLFEATKLTVDGVSFPEVFGNQFIFKPPVVDTNTNIKKSKEMAHLLRFKGNKGFSGGRIVLVNLEDADGLTATFHEIGHTRDKTDPIFPQLANETVRKFLSTKKNAVLDMDISDARESAEAVLKYEMYANKMAVRAVIFLKTKGIDLFKRDPDLARFKKFLLSTTKTRLYKNPKLTRLIGKERVREILTL